MPRPLSLNIGMSLHGFQSVLVRLYTSEQALRELEEGKSSHLASSDLTEKERATLADVDLRALRLFAQGLRFKQRDTAKKMLERFPRSRMISSCYRSAPVLFSGRPSGELACEILTREQFRILRSLYPTPALSLRAVSRSLLADDSCSISDGISLLWKLWRTGSFGKMLQVYSEY